MKFSVADLLDQLSTDQSVSLATLAKILKLTNKADKAGLELATQALAKIGALDVLDNGELQRLDNEALIDARLRCSSKGFCFAIRDDGGDDHSRLDLQVGPGQAEDRREQDDRDRDADAVHQLAATLAPWLPTSPKRRSRPAKAASASSRCLARKSGQ